MTVHGDREVTGTESGLQGNGPPFFRSALQQNRRPCAGRL